MRSGWYQHSFEHSLARRGIATQKYRMKYPKLVKPFKGQNPRLTSNYARFRQASPTQFVAGTFRTKSVSPKVSLIVAKQKRDKKFEVQSVMVRRTFAKKSHMKSGSEVKQLAVQIARSISKDSSRVAVAGSIRRGVEDPADVDIVIVPKSDSAKSEIREYLRSRSSKVYQDGESKFAGRIDGVKTEVYFSKPDEFGAQLMRATGPAGANIQKSALARSKGLKLSQHGLFKGNRRIATSESAIYNKLGLTYRRPELRGTPRMPKK